MGKPGEVLEEILEAMHSRGEKWNDSWKAFLTPRIRKLIAPWDVCLFREIGNMCLNLGILLVSPSEITITADELIVLPRNLHTLDLDGELYFAGRSLPSLNRSGAWLEDVDFWIRRLKIERLSPPALIPSTVGLTALHLGKAAVTAEELVKVLEVCPALTFLRHYQLVTALCQMHMDQWKSSQHLPKYRLVNIDADFSHIVRCRMSPKAVLPADALGLAVVLCPGAISVRIRFDNSTSHHVVGYLLGLSRLEEFSAVCVSSGERVLLDFQDFGPILQHFGPTSLKSLELKVVEEVDPHEILKSCRQLEELTVSGCGFAQNCRGARCRPGPSLPALRTIFYADGDDFSWDHTLPQCFWVSIFGNSKSRACKVEGLFLESPRMTEDTLDQLLGEAGEFVQLKAVCVKRSPEWGKERLSQLVGLSPRLEYLRCEGLGPGAASVLLRLRPQLTIKID